MVDKQLEHLDPPKVSELQMKPALPRAATESTMFPNLSLHIADGSPKMKRQLSCDTVTRAVCDAS